jgi:hypothetical protein
MPSLLEEPIPELVHYVDTNPYDDPANPPSDPVNLPFIHFQSIELIGFGIGIGWQILPQIRYSFSAN